MPTPARPSFAASLASALSPRRHRPEPVPRPLLREVLDAATFAPSNFNRQPWQFLLADDPASVRLLADLLGRRRQQFTDHSPTPAEWAPLLDACRPAALEQSPVLVLAFYKPSPERIEQVIADTLGTGDVTRFNPNLVSLGMAVLNLMLAAHERGLAATVHFAAVPFLAGEVNRRLRLPPNLHLAGVIALGHPAEDDGRPAPAPAREGVVRFLDPAADDAGPEAAPGDTVSPRSFAELARTRSSVRRYQPRPVPRALLEHFLDLATTVPWPQARPPWRFVVADAAPRREQIARLLLDRIAAVERLDLDADAAYFVHPFLDHQRQWNYPLEEGRALILCCYQEGHSPFHAAIASALGDGDAVWRCPELFGLGMAIQVFLLAAHAHGLGACMQSGPAPFLRGVVNASLGLPPEVQLAGVVSLGYPAEAPAPKGRRPPERVARYLSDSISDPQKT